MACHCPQGPIGRTCATAPQCGPLVKLLWTDLLLLLLLLFYHYPPIAYLNVFCVAGSLFGSQRSLVERKHSSLSNRSSSDVAYHNVPSTDNVTVTVGNPTTVRNPPTAGNPVTSAISDPDSTSAATYYNIPKLTPRCNSRSGGQPEQSTNNLQGPENNILSNPPVPRRHKLPTGRSCAPGNVTHSSKDATSHFYCTFSMDINRRNAASCAVPRSESLNNVVPSSPSRKEKSSSSSNNSSNNRNSRRRYSVGDILYKLQAVVSGGFSLPRGLVRSMSRFSVSSSANPASSPNKVSPTQSTSDAGFFSPGLKQRSASEILHRSPQADDVAPRKSPSPEKEVPPVPPPRLVVRPKPPAKNKVLRTVWFHVLCFSKAQSG